MIISVGKFHRWGKDERWTGTFLLDNLIYEISSHLRSRSLTTIPSRSPSSEHSNRLIELTSETFHSTVVNTRKVSEPVCSIAVRFQSAFSTFWWFITRSGADSVVRYGLSSSRPKSFSTISIILSLRG